MTTTRLKWAWMALCIAGAAGCLTSSSPGPTVDSETHFLRACSQSCPGDLQCICGVCSVTCDPARDCSGTHAAASCVSSDSFASEGACSADADPSVCDVRCKRDADCAGLSDRHHCLEGHCRAGASASSTDGCEYDGRTYEVGESFDATDGCNTCICGEGGVVSCTDIGCVPAEETCEYDGVTYEVGESFDATDGCNTCVCDAGGEVGCTGRGCNVCALPFEAGPCEAVVPVYWHNPDTGACESRIYGGCDGNGNRFDSLEDCAAACGHVAAGDGRSCMVGGEIYADGEQVPDPFSCNTCTCNDGTVDACTEIACPTSCPPNSVEASDCAQCGVAGGCDVVETACLPVCSSDEQCDDPRPFCNVDAGYCTREGLCD